MLPVPPALVQKPPLPPPPPPTPAPLPAPMPRPLPEATKAALLEALANGRKCDAAYAAVLARFGAVEPFLNIVDAERKDQEALLGLFRDHGVEVPAYVPDPNPPLPPATLQEACALGVKLEEATIAMYDRLLAQVVRESDVRRLFRRMQAASRSHHLPAFQRCAL